MVEKRKDFLINSAYVALWLFFIYIGLKFMANYLMPFVAGFIIAFMLKPVVRKLNSNLGENKVASIIVTFLFYVLVLLFFTWIVFSLIALIQHYIPIVEEFFNSTLMPMANDFFVWFEKLVQNLDPRLANIVDRGLTELEGALESIFEFISKGTLAWVTALVTATPRIMVAIFISVISSFFFSMDYQRIVNSFFKIIPERVGNVLMDIKNLFTNLLGQYALAYGKLMFITFIQLSIGFFILRVDSPIKLAIIVAVVDVLPVLGTGTVLIPWLIYEFAVGSFTMGLGLSILYGVIMVVRNILEPRIVGKQMGIHPLLTLVSIFVGVKILGFWGIFGGPIAVTIFKTLHEQGKIDLLKFLKGESEVSA